MENSSRTGCDSHPFLHLQDLAWVLIHGRALGNFTGELEKEKKKGKKKREKERRKLGEREKREQIDKGVSLGKRKERKRMEKKVQGQYGILFSSHQWSQISVLAQ